MNLAPVLTLDVVIQFIVDNGIDDPRIYAYLTRHVDRAKMDHWARRIERINAIKKPNGISPKVWEGRTNELKGRCFEKIGGVLLSSAKPFHSYKRVVSTTNEIDWLVELGPSAKWIPATSEWGTHFICECKFGRQRINAGWIGKLNTTLIGHSASVGLLISTQGLGQKGSQKLRFQLQLIAAAAKRVIICINTEEMRKSIEEGNFLRLICQRYVQTKVGATNLAGL